MSDRSDPTRETRKLSADLGLEPGASIAGRYFVEEELGRGGMARVYRVHDVELDERVALKLLNLPLSQQSEVLEQFRQEIRLARRIIHRNVCRIYDLGRWEELWFVTMELIDGETLGERMQRGALGGLPERLAIFRDVLIGLRAAHGTGVVHLDIKPGNIMITTEGRSVVMDFGLAGERGQAARLSDGSLLGTPAYMPPERFKGEPAGFKADIYSLGILLYELVSGKLPFEGTVSGILRGHLYQEPPELESLVPDVPEAIIQAIGGMLAKDPAERLASVDRVLEILAGIRDEGQGRTAVVAVGDEHLGALVTHHLGAVGIQGRAAEDGEEVIEEVLREAPDVVILDAHLEKIDGFRVAEILRRFQHAREIPVYVLTEGRNPALATYARQLGVTRLVRRPFASRAFAAEVEQLLGETEPAN